MKKSKKLRVSWPSDSLLCQVKMFLKDDCPAKISSHQSIIKPKAMNLLPPGYEQTQYASSRLRNKISHIPRIKWKKPPKFMVNGALLVVNGEESRETRDENLRIDKVLEALYPHRSAIPHSPSVSLAVEVERYDDSKTPNIRLTPIEDEPQAVSVELPSSTKQVLLPPGLGPELSLALTALMKQNKEQESNIDADLLVKLLSDPNTVKNLLINGTKGIPLDTENTNINITKPSLVPQHVTSSSSAMDIRNPSPKPIPFLRNDLPRNVPVSVQSSVSVSSMKPCSVVHTYPLSTGLKKPLPLPQDSYQTAISRPNPVDAVLVSVSEQKSVSKIQSQPFKVMEPPRNGTDSQIRNGLARNVPVPVQSSVSTEPPLPKSSQAMCSVVSMKPSSVAHTYPLSTGLKKPQGLYQTTLFEQNSVDAVSVSVSEQKTVSVPKLQSQSTRNGTDLQTGNVAYSNDQVSVGPVKNLDYFKNLIREHGGVVIPQAATKKTKETNYYKGRIGQYMKKVNTKKVQKQCMYFGKGKGCKLGESCLFLHDNSKRVWPKADLPREAKRFKFGT